jgi:hypothetical protein
MRVQFHRTAERRYSIVVLREGMDPLRMESAPGFDPLMPHDLQHFVVEQELGIKLGIFGQLAAGGTAGTFHHQHSQHDRKASRSSRRAKKRGRSLSAAGHSDSMRSERATYICWFNWLSASNEPELVRRAADMADTARSMLSSMPDAERKTLSKATIQRISSRMDVISRQWAGTAIGQTLELAW